MTQKKLNRVLLAVAAIALPLALSGCGTVDDDGAAEGLTPLNEPEIPPHNTPSTIWIPGYWAPGETNDFVWIPGQIVERPSPTAVWTPARWARHNYGWSFQEGHWE